MRTGLGDFTKEVYGMIMHLTHRNAITMTKIAFPDGSFMEFVMNNLQTVADEQPVRDLYLGWLAAWNRRSADAMAALVAPDGVIVGFDGSQMAGPAEVAAQIGQIFHDHQTAPYIGIVRTVKFLSPDVALLHAVVGMVARGTADINPAVNAIQSLVATRDRDAWRITLFQNTPAAFHGRPELSDALTAELRAAYQSLQR
jgi:uncharacterized protein (TIGR02246 family)